MQPDNPLQFHEAPPAPNRHERRKARALTKGPKQRTCGCGAVHGSPELGEAHSH